MGSNRSSCSAGGARPASCSAIVSDPAAARPSPHPSPVLPVTKARLSENATTFAPVVMAPAVTTPASLAPPPASPPAGMGQGVEIAIGAVVVRVGATVDAEVLAMVLAAVRRSS